MKLGTKQENAKAWNRSLTKLNEAQPGQIQITYENEQGQKQVGYLDLFDLKIVVDNKTTSLGVFMTDLINFNLKTLKQVETIAKGVSSVNSDLIVVKNDELGYIKEVLEFNQTTDCVIAKQQMPLDYNKGYYYVKDGVIIIDEVRKLVLFPDYV